MKKETKSYRNFLLIESLFMLSMIVAACLSGLLQQLGKIYVRDTMGFLFWGKIYKYNTVAYLAGIFLYTGLAVFLFKKILKRHFSFLKACDIKQKILAWIVVLIWGFGMVVAHVFMNLLTSGLKITFEPEILFYMSIFGWPVITVIILGVIIIRNSNKTI